MTLLGRFWSSLTQFLSIATLSPFGDYGNNGNQQVPILDTEIPVGESFPLGPGPVFTPPGHRTNKGYGYDFKCNYSSMVGWEPCHETNSSCWLRNTKNGDEFNIDTNYENLAPQGVLRKYTLEIVNGSVNADGMNFAEAKLFKLPEKEPQYPGPWLQACWGDTVQVTVVNKLPYNGTSIHWHGIRQNQTMHMDGVNGITQCPTRPGDSFVYEWKAVQYGSTWYHSHYSLQYADGLLGPMTLHGPTSDQFTEAADIPLLMTDWAHNSAFAAIYPVGAQNQTILLNGRGNITKHWGTPAPLDVPAPYTLHFDGTSGAKGYKRYLLRLINTSWDTTFVFSIDNHELTIVGADFVPIHPYKNTSVLIGIGQRYNVIVEAKPITEKGNVIPTDKNFWMRTYVAPCFGVNTTVYARGYETTGILRYDSTSKAPPTSKPWSQVSLKCSDETYSSLKPILPWTIGNPSNAGQEHDVIVDGTANRTELGPFGIFSMEPTTFNSKFLPLRIDFDNPIFLHLNETKNSTDKWPERWIVVPESYGDEDWVYLVVAGNRKKDYSASAHPMHLHGHDFAILEQAENKRLDYGNLDLKFDNPPRRDVVLLPVNGYIVIAFKTDNPGAWLMHCHIAKHAAMGLALQILERQKAADRLWNTTSPAWISANDNCKRWKEWQSDCDNWWPGDKGGCERKEHEGIYAFQDDSGI
ncbi:multicopper oxidase-domain-containing protein [Lasiosphaeria miniovina]|uniref:Multicopper oxidase-domain-containing protein n=1 Tax=Lasiosphaeria miniovina TaxID=1954250 RepID=A0AA40BEY3_9PEZI|nr:multicopper oxidase-domain-containing protein [Lasiosphaeria miniovina]KAK0733004.1 multicopper oxidase-domain-containing protein [Lasiosphaeria miniovina]